MSQPSVSGTGLDPILVSAAGHRVLPEDAVVDFPDKNWSTATTLSSCEFKGQTFTSAGTFPPSEHIALKVLWPAALWKKLSNDDLKQSECDIAFRVVNSNGSTQEFEIVHTKLASFAAMQVPTKLNFSESADVSAIVSASLLPIELTKSIKKLGASADVSLVCEGISARLPVKTTDWNIFAVRMLMTQIPLKGQHACHFVVDDSVETLLPSGFDLTSEVILDFPKPQLSVSMSQPMISMLTATTSALFQFHIVNNESVPAYVRIETPDSAAIRLVFEEKHNGVIVGYLESSGAFAGELVSTSPQANKLSNGVFKIDPRSEADLVVTFANVNPVANCLAQYRQGLVGLSSDVATAVGFKYTISSRLAVQQVDNPEADGKLELRAIEPGSAETMPASTVFTEFVGQYGPSVATLQTTRYFNPSGAASCL